MSHGRSRFLTGVALISALVAIALVFLAAGTYRRGWIYCFKPGMGVWLHRGAVTYETSDVPSPYERSSLGFYHTKGWLGPILVRGWAPVLIPRFGRDQSWMWFRLPLWMPILLGMTIALVAWRRGRVVRGSGCCSRCGYDLTGNVSGRCPECGDVREAGLIRPGH